MKRRYSIALASLLCAGVAMPVAAQGYRGDRGSYDRYDRFDYIGTVEFDRNFDRERQYGNFGGPVEAIRLEARDSAVQCRNVRITFGNGRSRNVFQGRLVENRNVTVDLPGDERNIRRIDFACRALSPYGSRVDIAADIGRYREAWQRNPNFGRDRRFPWAGEWRQAQWEPLGMQRFHGWRDNDTTFIGPRGGQIESLAIRPLNADARCRRITATFANGRTRELAIGPADYLAENQLYRIDLPGLERNVERIDMTCRPLSGPGVTMQVLASR